MLKLYDELARWYPLLTAAEEYAEEADIYARLLDDACDAPIQSLLELGCGTGCNASHLKHRYAELVLTDLAPAMVEISRAANPECEHHVADMRSVRLERAFDAVFVHDAVVYMTTEEDLARVIETAWTHCRPGGAVLFAPDYVRETFPGDDLESGGHDDDNAAGGRGLRYLAWVTDPDPDDTTYAVDYAYLLRDRDGTVRVVHERHIEGLFSRDRWLTLLGARGLDARVVPLVHSEVEPGRHEMFVARRPR